MDFFFFLSKDFYLLVFKLKFNERRVESEIAQKVTRKLENLICSFYSSEIIKEKFLMIMRSDGFFDESFIKGNCTNLNLNKIGDVNKVKLHVFLASLSLTFVQK